jgi:hypothetical protein
MKSLTELTDMALTVKYLKCLRQYELSGGTKFVHMLEVLKREKGRRFHMKRKRPRKSGEAREADARARAIFHR